MLLGLFFVFVLQALIQPACALTEAKTKQAITTRGWEYVRDVAPGTNLHLHIGVKQNLSHARLIEQTAQEIADPEHTRYRKFLNAEDLLDLADTSNASSQIVKWLSGHGITATAGASFINADVSVGVAETLLSTTYKVYSDGVRAIARAEQITLPGQIDTLVDFITPSVHFPAPSKADLYGSLLSSEAPSNDLVKRSDASNDPCGGTFVTPACITKTYNISYKASPNRTTFAIYGTEAATFSPRDLQTFLERYNEPAAEANAQFEQVGSGDPADRLPGIGSAFETALDTQTALGTAWPAHGILYNLGGVFGPSSSAGKVYDPFVQFLQELIYNETVPSVVSFSESMPEDMVDPDYAQHLCTLMAQVGMRGVSLLFSSGDNGPNGDQPTGTHDAVFEVEFPASCPWVTSVGGTTNPLNETAATKETMHGGGEGYYASGGGFSNLFTRPTYQDDTVPAYIDKHIPMSYHSVSGFNGSGRGVPDVSALSTSLPVVVAGITIPVGGTSASTPLWAALITLLNDYEASQGRPSLGFLNPWLYSLAGQTAALSDIATGGNSAGSCFFLTGCKLKETLGYNVTTGWDPVTGLGVPNFDGLLALLR